MLHIRSSVKSKDNRSRSSINVLLHTNKWRRSYHYYSDYNDNIIILQINKKNLLTLITFNKL